MDETTRNDIRRLLKTFGVQADEAIMAHLESAPGAGPLRLRLTLEDLTDYGESPPAAPLRVAVEGDVQR